MPFSTFSIVVAFPKQEFSSSLLVGSSNSLKKLKSLLANQVVSNLALNRFAKLIHFSVYVLGYLAYLFADGINFVTSLPKNHNAHIFEMFRIIIKNKLSYLPIVQHS